jgi:branched-subunit amino acid aminotransferase/4-amino-4-deoxychorismate lyase
MEPIAYVNGDYIPISKAALHVFDLGVVAGATVSEMIRTFGHRPFRLPEHLDRMQRSQAALGFETRLTVAEWTAICQHVVSENSKFIPSHHDLGLIAFVTAGQNLTYLGQADRDRSRRGTVCVHTFPLPFELWAETYEHGIHLVTVETRSIPDQTLDARIKHRSRLHWHVADQQAKQKETTAVAVLSDNEGYLTETSAGNVWLVHGKTLVTPAKNVLHGISRDEVFLLANVLHLPAQLHSCRPQDIASADEVFISSTPNCLLPVTKYNGQPVGHGHPGPIFRQLINAWSQSVGIDIVEQMQRGAIDRKSAS